MFEQIDEFLSYLSTQKRYSIHTITSYKNDISSAVTYFISLYEIETIETVKFFHLRSYIVAQLKQGMSAKTVNRKISALRSFYKYLVKKDIVIVNPMLKIVAPKIPKRLPDFVSKSDVSTLFDSLPFGDLFSETRDYIIILILYNTGIRKSELIGLTNKSIDFAQKRMSVVGKGNKERIIPISTSLIVKLKQYIKLRNTTFGLAGNTLLLTDKGNKLYPKFVYNVVNRVLTEIATNTRKSPHILRHTFATHMANNGAELNCIKELLGHSRKILL